LVVSAFLTDGDNRVTISSRQPSFRTITIPRFSITSSHTGSSRQRTMWRRVYDSPWWCKY